MKSENSGNSKRLLCTILAAIMVLSVCAVIPVTAVDVSVTRDLPDAVSPGEEFEVSLTQSGFYITGSVTETLPEGFEYKRILSGGKLYEHDETTNELTIDFESETVTYVVKAGTAEQIENAVFSGTWTTVDSELNKLYGSVEGDTTLMVSSTPTPTPTATPSSGGGGDGDSPTAMRLIVPSTVSPGEDFLVTVAFTAPAPQDIDTASIIDKIQDSGDWNVSLRSVTPDTLFHWLTNNLTMVIWGETKTIKKGDDVAVMYQLTVPEDAAGVYYFDGELEWDDEKITTTGADHVTVTTGVEEGSIVGQITYTCNTTGIAGVNVNLTKAIFDGGIEVVNSTTTNDTGYYNFTDVAPNGYFVNASKPRFWDNSTEVTVSAGETSTANLALLLKGDLYGNDCVVDMWDFTAFAIAYGTVSGEPNYNVLADIYPDIPDGVVDMWDLTAFAIVYGYGT